MAKGVGETEGGLWLVGGPALMTAIGGRLVDGDTLLMVRRAGTLIVLRKLLVQLLFPVLLLLLVRMALFGLSLLLRSSFGVLYDGKVL